MVGDLVSCIFAMVGETNFRRVEVFSQKMEVGGSPDFIWYGKDDSLNTYCEIVVRLVPEAEWKVTSMLRV